jgi:excisionase family DNA binding protein
VTIFLLDNTKIICCTATEMKTLSTREAAQRLGIDPMTLGRYIKAGKVPAPRIFESGRVKLHGWTEEEVEGLRKLLPKIANGRKTRWQKIREKQKAQTKSPVPRKPKKK